MPGDVAREMGSYGRKLATKLEVAVAGMEPWPEGRGPMFSSMMDR